MRIFILAVALLLCPAIAAAQSSPSDLDAIANILRQRQAAPEPHPELVEVLVELLKRNQTAAPQDSPELLALVSHLRRGIVPQVVNEHKYVLPATMPLDNRPTLNVQRDQRPRVLVELAPIQFCPRWIRNFAGNARAMFYRTPPCINPCADATCDTCR